MMNVRAKNNCIWLKGSAFTIPDTWHSWYNTAKTRFRSFKVTANLFLVSSLFFGQKGTGINTPSQSLFVFFYFSTQAWQCNAMPTFHILELLTKAVFWDEMSKVRSKQNGQRPNIQVSHSPNWIRMKMSFVKRTNVFSPTKRIIQALSQWNMHCGYFVRDQLELLLEMLLHIFVWS